MVNMLTALLVIAILFFLIVVHELGHFVAAKLFRVRVDEFGIGYPPRALSFGTWGGTEYTLNWIPFGGFVRLWGEEAEGQHGKGSLMDAPHWKQGVILLAGVAMNAVGAWFLFAVALHTGVPQAVESVSAGQHAQLIISDVVAGSPAEAAGLKAGDEVTGVHDDKGVKLAELNPEKMVAFVSARGGHPITISYIDNDKAGVATVTPANAVVPGAEGRPALGLALALVTIQSAPWGQAIVNALYQTWNAFGIVASSLWSLVSGVLHGAPNLSQVVGPVGIVNYVGQASQEGFGSVLLLAALISINLVLINLIPIPALDGGRLLVLIIEAATRRQAPRLAVQVLNFVGVSLIVLLMLVVTYHDIGRLFA